VTTTIDPRKGRHPSRREGRDVDDTLASARRIFADVSAFLELEIDRLFAVDVDPVDENRLKTVLDLIRQNQQALLKVLEMRQKLGRELAPDCRQMIDLEAARAEIESRLARLAG